MLTFITYLRTSKTILAISFLASFACILLFSLYVEPGLNPSSGRSHVIGLQLAFQKSEGLLILDAWGDTGRIHFLDTIWIDFVFPAAYSLLLASLVARSLHRMRSPGWMGIFVLVPFDAALLDCIENVIEIMFVSNPDAVSENIFFTHSVIALLKWGLAVSTLLFLTATVIHQWQHVMKKR